MAKFRIISKDGTTVRYEGCPRYSGSYMGVPALDFSEITSPVPIAWEIGDYVDYRNGRYYLYSLPEPKKQARRGEYGAAFVYSGVQFHSPVKDFEIALFRDIVTEDNKIHFSTMPEVNTYEDVFGIARRIQACMDDIFPGKWRIDVYDGYDNDLDNLLSEVKEFSLSGGTCLDALSLIYDLWANVGWVYATDRGKPVIIIGRANVRDEGNTTLPFSYGKGNGLTAIKRASANKEEFATRLYVYGSDRNLPPRYYNSKNIKDADSVHIPNLMLPIGSWGITDGLPDPRLAYVEASEDIIRKYGLIPRVIRFDGTEREEIYPSIEGLTEARVRQAMIDAGYSGKYLPGDNATRIDEVVDAFIPDHGYIADADGTAIEVEQTFTLEIGNIGFDINEQAALANEKSAIISMKSGMCAGREFPVKEAKWDGGTWVLTMERQLDESLNMLFPNFDYIVKAGDRFVILDIAMPDYYVTLAQERMYEEGMKVLADYTRTSAYYEPQIDAKALYESKAAIREGMYMKVVDEDVIETESKEDYVIIDSLSIDEKTEIPTYSVTLREQKRAARGLAALEDMVEDAKEGSSKEVEEVRKMTQRRFASALDTISMLQGAMANFTEGINPVAVQTMAMLVGDESLQFKFTSAAGTTTLKLPVTYDAGARILKISRSYRLWHMTLGIDSVTSPTGRSDDDYLKWTMPAWESDVLADGSKGYYLYAKVPNDGTSGNYLLSESTIAMESESGYYHLLVGILNREYDGTREFVSLYGFTEVLPGQITTDVIRSADGSCYFDLENNEIGGRIKFLAGSEGVENLMADVTVGGENMLRNSGFTGDYLSERLADDIVLEATSQMYNNPLAYWTGSVNVKVNEDEQSESGRSATISNGVLTQQLYHKTIAGEKYILSFKAKGTGSLSVTMGGTTYILAIDSEEYKRYTYAFEAAISTPGFVMVTSDTVTLCEIQLERGTVPTAWSNSFLDNSSDRAYYQALKYLSDAIKGTTIIDGGLILTNHMKLGEYSDDQFVERAGVNGLYADDDSPAFWAGGTVAQAEELLKRIAEGNTDLDGLADFVVTHGGMAVLRNILLFANNGSLGGLKVTDKGLEVDTDSDGEIVFTKQGFRARQKDGSSTEIGTCGSQALLVMGKDAAGGQCYVDENKYKIAAQINAADNGHAIHSLSGLYAGLRPNIRAIYENDTLDALDHTVIVDNGSQMTLTLPSTPRTGQTYKIIHRSDKPITLSSSKVIIDVSESYSEVGTIGERGVTILTYYDEMWYAELK